MTRATGCRADYVYAGGALIANGEIDVDADGRVQAVGTGLPPTDSPIDDIGGLPHARAGERTRAHAHDAGSISGVTGCRCSDGSPKGSGRGRV